MSLKDMNEIRSQLTTAIAEEKFSSESLVLERSETIFQEITKFDARN